ncbi:MAG: glycosyltransferase [Candidatus Atribacteria bacterium]|nr:glycosyltransferase [Candidatus Atribacteria bacterium]
MVKKRLAYISSESFVHGDKPVLLALSKVYEIGWFIVFKENSNASKFKPADIEAYAQKIGLQNTFKISRKIRSRNPLNIYKDFKDIVKKVRIFSPDYVLVEGAHNPYWPLVARLSFKSKKMVFGIHNAIPHSSVGGCFHYLRDMLSFRLFKNYLFYSSTQKNIFDRHIPGKNTFHIDLFLKDYGEASQPRQDVKHNNFLFFGTAYYYKGLDILLDSLEILSKYDMKYNLKIAGRFPDNDYLNHRVLKNNPNVEIDNRLIPNEEIPDLFSKADFLILPYRDVTQAGPLLIAYNYNLPVIASDHDWFQTKIKNNETGMLFRSKDSQSLGSILFQAICMSNEEYALMKHKLSRYIKDNFSEESMISKYKNLFKSLK